MKALVSNESDLAMESGGDGESVEIMEDWCNIIWCPNSLGFTNHLGF